MKRWAITGIATVALAFLAGCNRGVDRGSAVEQPRQEEASVSFDLEPQPSRDGSQEWIGVYNSSGKVARFRMDFGAAESVPGKAAGDPVVLSGEGTLLPEPGSDPSALLTELQKALRAKGAATAPVTKISVPFTYVKIGEHLSPVPGGGFNASPPGDWMGMKLIFGDGDRVSEVYLHINVSAKKAQFSMKDPRYGDLVLTELAKAL